jgi:transcriptional regulator with XRE-family HTH domain
VPKTTRFSRRTFGQAIRQERERLGLSQEEFAERATVHRTYISSIELGKVSMGIEIAHALAGALGMRLRDSFAKQSNGSAEQILLALNLNAAALPQSVRG